MKSVCTGCYLFSNEDIRLICWRNKLSKHQIIRFCEDHFNNYGFDEGRIGHCTNLCKGNKKKIGCSSGL